MSGGVSALGLAADLSCAIVGGGDQPGVVVWTPGHGGDFARVAAEPAVRLCQHHRTFWRILYVERK